MGRVVAGPPAPGHDDSSAACILNPTGATTFQPFCPIRSVPVILIKANVCDLLEQRLKDDRLKVEPGSRHPRVPEGIRLPSRVQSRFGVAGSLVRRPLLCEPLSAGVCTVWW